MALTVLYFARLREALGVAQERLPAEAETVDALLAQLRARGGPWQSLLSDAHALRVAVNQDLAAHDTPLRDGDEIALFPPVTGG